MNTCPECGLRVIQARYGTETVLLDPVPSINGAFWAYQPSAGGWQARADTIEPPPHPLERRYAPHAPACTAAAHPADPRTP